MSEVHQKEEEKKSYIAKTGELVSGHPYIIIGIIILLLIIIIYMYLQSTSYFGNKKSSFKKKKENKDNNDEEKLDEIIEELNVKQDNTNTQE